MFPDLDVVEPFTLAAVEKNIYSTLFSNSILYSLFLFSISMLYFYALFSISILYSLFLFFILFSILCYAMLCYVMLCYAMLCYAMLFLAMLFLAMLFLAMLLNIGQAGNPLERYGGTRYGSRRTKPGHLYKSWYQCGLGCGCAGFADMEHFGLHLLELHKWNLDMIWELMPLFPNVLQLHSSLNVKPPGTQNYVTCNLRDMEAVLRDARTCILCIKLLKDNFKQQEL
jgi:hypothetical protein